MPGALSRALGNLVVLKGQAVEAPGPLNVGECAVVVLILTHDVIMLCYGAQPEMEVGWELA